MGHTPHELAAEFPDRIDALHALKQSDAHFARLADDYHALNREIHRAESGVAPVDDFALENLKKRRLALLDEIAAQLAHSAA
jgi:uncharacterized protein YdcH (DUF465 family)